MFDRSYRGRLALYAGNPDELICLYHSPDQRRLMAQDLGDLLDEDTKWPIGARVAVRVLVLLVVGLSWALLYQVVAANG